MDKYVIMDCKRLQIISELVLHLIHIKYKISKDTIKELIEGIVKSTLNEIYQKVKDVEAYKRYQSISSMLTKCTNTDIYQVEYNNYKKLIIKLIISLMNDIILMLIFNEDKLTNIEYIKRCNEMEDYINYTVTLILDNMVNNMYITIRKLNDINISSALLNIKLRPE